MRCQFCGWDNPQDRANCEKCNKPLTDGSVNESNDTASSAAVNHNRPTDRKPAGDFNPKATVREGQIGTKSKPQENTCPECGYTLENGECSSCGYKASAESEHRENKSENSTVCDFKKTVRPKRKGDKEGKFSLFPISEETGEIEGDALEFEGNTVALNRDNTAPKNSTITSIQQAVVAYDGGKWSIEDHSEYKTTFVQAARKIELKSGDLILLGNQLYRFEV